MRRFTQYVLWLYVFTVTWDTVALPLVGSVSRLLGLAVVGLTVLTTAAEGRFRKPDAILGFAIAFAAWGALSLSWTVSYETTLIRATTYAQLVASLWVIRELVRTREQVQPLMLAFCIGSFVLLSDLLSNFKANVEIGQGTNRFSGSGLNADMLGLTLVIVLPMAWHLIIHRGGMVRAVAMVYFVLTPLALLLTATRGAFVAGFVALAIIPLSLPRQSLKSYARAGGLLVAATILAALIVPRSNWDRLLSIQTEVTEGGKMSGRTDIWKAGLQVFPQSPLVGVGAGAYGVATAPFVATQKVIFSHNVPLGLLVEGGIIGLCIFLAFLWACARTIVRSPPPYRALWSVLTLTWLVGAMSANWESVKLTWVLFGLVAAQSGLRKTSPAVSPVAQQSAASVLTPQFLNPVPLSRTARWSPHTYR